MKRIISACLLLAIAITICACSGKNSGPKLEEGVVYAGYHRTLMTPEEPVPLGGYGNTSRRFSREVLNDIYVTTVALTDGEGETVLLMTWDMTRAYNHLVPLVREGIIAQTGIPADHIMVASSHTHSGPDMTNTKEPSIVRFADRVVQCAVDSAVKALDDRKPAEFYIGNVEATGLNFVKHYMHTLPDGTVAYFGDNFGTAVYDDTTTHTTYADPTMHLMKVTREGGKDIVLANWRAHPQLTGGTEKYVMSADFVGTFRDALESQVDCHFVYFQGAAGNINPSSRMAEENFTKDVHVYGAKLAEYAMEGLANMKKVEVDDVSTRQTIFAGPVNHSQDHLYYQAKEIAAVWAQTADRQRCLDMGKPYGIRSPYHANAIVSKHDRGETLDLELNAITLGDSICIVTAPNELFDTNSEWLEENSPYEQTFTFGYANGHWFYIPSQLGFDYTCYESDNCQFIPGTGEEVQNIFLSMLKDIKAS